VNTFPSLWRFIHDSAFSLDILEALGVGHNSFTCYLSNIFNNWGMRIVLSEKLQALFILLAKGYRLKPRPFGSKVYASDAGE
jgi:hypothetical protein